MSEFCKLIIEGIDIDQTNIRFVGKFEHCNGRSRCAKGCGFPSDHFFLWRYDLDIVATSYCNNCTLKRPVLGWEITRFEYSMLSVMKT